jgi:hypothetical protein
LVLLQLPEESRPQLTQEVFNTMVLKVHPKVRLPPARPRKPC